MEKKTIRVATKQPGIYKNKNTGKYDVKYCYTAVDPSTNKKKHYQKWFSGINSYREAKELLAKKRGKCLKTLNQGCTLKMALDLWEEKAVASKYSPVTIRNTKQQFNMIQKFWSSELVIDDITEGQYLKLITNCRKYGYSEETVWNINSCIRKIIRLAYKNRYIDEDPTQFWDNPRIETGVRRNVITWEDFKKLDEYFLNNEFYRCGVNHYPKYRFLVNLLYFSGLRIGEAIALNYEDFVKGRYRNRDIMRITVNKSYNSHHRILKGTKTGKNRKVPIPKRLTTVYKEILDTHIKEGGTLDDRIITWDHSACRMMIEKACKEVGIRSYCCHDFRHTYISNLIKKGVPLPIIESASGDTQETIFKHYSHMFEGDEQMLLDSFDDFE